MTVKLNPDERKRRDSLAQDYVMEMLRKSRPQSMDVQTCVKFAQAAYRLADAMLITSLIQSIVEVTTAVEHPKPAPAVEPSRFITTDPTAVYKDGLWVNVNLDFPGEVSMPGFVGPGDTVKAVYENGQEYVSKAGDRRIDWRSVKSFRKLG